MRFMIDKIKADLICKMHYESVHKFCVHQLKCNHFDADDVTQEVFVLFQQKADTLEDKNIKGWLFSTANLKVKEFYRKRGKEMDYIPIEYCEIEDTAADVCTMLEEHNNFDIEKIDQYRDVIFRHLSNREKELYQKHYVERKSHSQIAEEMNTNAKNVSVMVSRLRKKIEFMELLVLCTLGQWIIKLFF